MLEKLRVMWTEIDWCQGWGQYAWPATKTPIVPYSSRSRMLCSNEAHEIEMWFLERGLTHTVALDTEFERDHITGRDVMVLVQFACSHRVLLTNSITSRMVLKVLLSPQVMKVGKDLRGDWDALEAALTQSDVSAVELLDGSILSVQCVLAAGSVAAGWRDVSELLPLHRIDASCEAIARFVLRQSATWKSTVNHEHPPRWNKVHGLDKTCLAYAISDACFVWDVMLAVKAKVVCAGGVFPWSVGP